MRQFFETTRTGLLELIDARRQRRDLCLERLNFIVRVGHALTLNHFLQEGKTLLDEQFHHDQDLAREHGKRSSVGDLLLEKLGHGLQTFLRFGQIEVIPKRVWQRFIHHELRIIS